MRFIPQNGEYTTCFFIIAIMNCYAYEERFILQNGDVNDFSWIILYTFNTHTRMYT